MTAFLAQALSNKHTASAAAVYFICKTLPKVLAIWLPSHKEDLRATGDQLAEFAVAYGFLMAGDANKSATKDDVKDLADKTAQAVKSGDTTVLTKQP